MAQLEKRIYAVLTGYTGVSALVGTRVYPLVLPQKCTFPAISYLRVSGGQQMNLSGYSRLEAPRIQVDAWAESYGQAKDLAAAIRAALLSATDFKVSDISDRDLFEDSSALFRVSTDFTVWHRDT